MLYFVFIIFCAFLPFQFALNPAPGIDLAIVRVIILLLFLAWLAYALKNKLALFEKNKITYFFTAFILLAIFSLFFSHNFAWSVRKLLFILSIAPIHFIAVSVLNTKDKQRMATVSLVFGAALAAFFGIIQFLAQFVFGIDSVYAFLANNITPFFLGNSFSQAVLAYPSWLVESAGATYLRAISIFPDPHMLSYYLGMLLPWSVALWATSRAHKKIFLISSLLLLTADVLTFSRGNYLALIVAAFVILPLVSKTTAKKLIAAIAIFIILFAIAPNNPVSGRFMSSFDIQEGSNQGRIENWKQAISVIAKNPLGVGIGMYPLAINPNADYREPIYAHNLYFDIAAELGIPAVLVFGTILYFAFKYFWQAAKKEPLFIAGVASVTVFSVHSLVETPLYSVHILSLFLVIIALSVLSKKYEQTADHQ